MIMAKLRFSALKEVATRTPREVQTPPNLSDFYGINVFDRKKMQVYLSKEAFNAVVEAIEDGTTINRKMADQVATGMCKWAKERGATHYTHWFQPLNDATAEKHERMFDFGENNEVLERFSGKLLIQQEPDASSFPSGGIRNTFEARGYTAWDVSSPAFIVGETLCIPTIFIAYTGEALDYKTPLLRALSVVDKAAVRVCQYFDKDVKKVNANLGWEQEYFLVDKALFNARPDLALTGRTLMGHASAKDQQLEDHYFASIPTRAMRFMSELELEGHKLGIPLKTRHNEVAPNQFECAPIFEEANLANDHNQLVMDLMKHIAPKHNFAVLLHEKPFAGINGSGKHNNWSLSTDTGVNLYSPAKNPKGNLLFLSFIVNTLKAVHDNQDLLRASIMSAENSHRLGANEAPPAILSVFLGSYITNMLDNLAEKVSDSKMTPEEKTALKLGIGRIPDIVLDSTDRNRTSPFAFTGNRFEFRAVGSSANCAAAMTALNSVIANQLTKFADEVDSVIATGKGKDEAIFHVMKRLIIESRPIRFEGDGYSQEWVEEAAKRGLTNITSAPDAIKKYLDKDAVKLLTGLGVYSEVEIHSRVEIEFEKFTKKIQIEARILGDLAINHIVPTAIAYQNRLIENIRGLKEVFEKEEFEKLADDRKELVREIGERILAIKTMTYEMIEARKVANTIENVEEKTFAYSTTVRPYLDKIRYHIDKLEEVVDDEMWPLPKYRELLFMK
jgi:glutamine synthetase